MGVLNVTPDSFSDGGAWLDLDAAVAHGLALVARGAAIVDVGGESTRPGARPVSIDEELRRVVPVVEALASPVAAAGARISVDTRHAEVAEAAAGAGARIINDVSASLHDVAARTGTVWIAMHMQGEPGTMQDDPVYDDVVEDVLAALLDAADRGRAAGVEEVWVDPGIGFGKTFAHNWTLLAHLDRFVASGLPVVVGASRKGFLGEALADADGAGQPVPPLDRIEGSVTTAMWAAALGVHAVRVHDVAETARALAHLPAMVVEAR